MKCQSRNQLHVEYSVASFNKEIVARAVFVISSVVLDVMFWM